MLNLFQEPIRQNNHFKYEWYLKDLPEIKENAPKAFGCFISCGGTSLGAKLAGFNHLGGVEIDKKIANLYKENLNPKYLFVEDIRDFKQKAIKGDIPSELYSLDILEGSPPCTTFSFCGDKQDSFGKKKKFAEGQSLQTLDDLVFEYSELAIILNPKVVFFENVSGFLSNFAKRHYNKTIRILEEAYYINSFNINFKYMGLPQSRTRCIIICTRKDLGYKSINLNYDEPLVPFIEYAEFAPMSNLLKQDANNIKLFIQNYREGYNGYYKRRCDDCYFTLQDIMPCLTNRDVGWNVEMMRRPTPRERIISSSFPLDYNFKNKTNTIFATGMCVPPLAAANIFYEIRTQILNK